MKVLLVTTLAGPGPIAGGVWSVAQTQAKALTEAGLSVRVLAGWLGNKASRPKDENVNRVRVYQWLGRKSLRALVAPSLVPHLVRELRLADVVHIHFARDLFTSVASVVAWIMRVPVVAQPHGMITAASTPAIRLYDLVLGRFAMRAPNLWLALTADEADALRQQVEGQVERIDNACLDLGYRWADPKDQSVLFAARLHARKQPEIFLGAVIDLCRELPDLQAVLAGPDGGALAGLKEAIIRSGLESRIKLTGSLEPGELADLMAASSCMVLPSRHEPYPMVVLESMAIGLPCILTEEIGPRELIRDYNAALFCVPNELETKNEIRRMLMSAKLRHQLSRNGRQLYEDRWSPSHLGSSLKRAYVEAITSASHQ